MGINEDRFVVPVPVSERKMDTSIDTVNFEITWEESPFSIKIVRKDDGQVLFDTAVGPVLFYRQLVQLSTRRPSDFIYGFGETEHLSFKHSTGYTAQGMWSRDNGVGPGANLYGVQPYHMTMEPSGKASGLLFFNANAMEVELAPLPVWIKIKWEFVFESVGHKLRIFFK